MNLYGIIPLPSDIISKIFPFLFIVKYGQTVQNSVHLKKF